MLRHTILVTSVVTVGNLGYSNPFHVEERITVTLFLRREIFFPSCGISVLRIEKVELVSSSVHHIRYAFTITGREQSIKRATSQVSSLFLIEI